MIDQAEGTLLLSRRQVYMSMGEVGYTSHFCATNCRSLSAMDHSGGKRLSVSVNMRLTVKSVTVTHLLVKSNRDSAKNLAAKKAAKLDK